MTVTARPSAARELAALLGAGAVLAGDDPAARPYLTDATETRAIRGRADAVALPGDTEQVLAALRWCYDHDVPVIPRGGGTGYAGGAVPVDGGVVLGLERLNRPPAIDPGEWRASVTAGATTADVRHRARENGLYYPVDPGAAESSHIGGNIATNAGGPHSFKYGVTGAWVTGLTAVVAPGELIELGGPIRKDVAGYDLRSLMIGSEGTLGIVTDAWLRLIPAPETALPVVGLYPTAEAGCAAIAAILAAGIYPSTIEFLDSGALTATLESLIAVAEALIPSEARQAHFMVIAEADGTLEEASETRKELREALEPGASSVYAPTAHADVRRLWRWREGVSLVVAAQRGGKLSEDIVVPAERLHEALEQSLEIGRRRELETCAWGHAGDGNIHATFMIDRDDPDAVVRAEAAARELFDLAVRLGGSVSGEHGVGIVKRGALAAQWAPRALDLHDAVKRAFDPKGLLNPGKKLAH